MLNARVNLHDLHTYKAGLDPKLLDKGKTEEGEVQEKNNKLGSTAAVLV